MRIATICSGCWSEYLFVTHCCLGRPVYVSAAARWTWCLSGFLCYLYCTMLSKHSSVRRQPMNYCSIVGPLRGNLSGYSEIYTPLYSKFCGIDIHSRFLHLHVCTISRTYHGSKENIQRTSLAANLRRCSLVIRYPFPGVVLNYRNLWSGFCHCTDFGNHLTSSSWIS